MDLARADTKDSFDEGKFDGLALSFFSLYTKNKLLHRNAEAKKTLSKYLERSNLPISAFCLTLFDEPQESWYGQHDLIYGSLLIVEQV